MHVAEHPAGLVGTNGDEAKVKGASVLADLRKGGAGGEVRVRGGVVVFCRGYALGYGSVARVSAYKKKGTC